MNASKAWRERLKRTSPEEYRRQRREEARRYRARKYARGLTAAGLEVARPDIASARRVYAEHPTDCLCRDCLFPPVPYTPTVYRSLASS